MQILAKFHFLKTNNELPLWGWGPGWKLELMKLKLTQIYDVTQENR